MRVALLWLLLGVAIAAAQAPDPLLAAAADPLELARVVDALGDDAVIERLSAETAAPVRLAAVRACPWLHAPERALPDLATLAAARDPDLAVAAALALVRVTEALDRAALDAREDDGEALRAAIEPLTALAADGTARPDVRYAASVARSHVAALILPPEPIP